MRTLFRAFVTTVAACVATFALAAPSLVSHNASNQVYGEVSGITMREPDVPREDDITDIWIKIGPSFTYDRVAVYYTTDGTTPSGSLGNGTGSTQVLRSSASQITFIRNEPRGGGGNDDWWKTTLPVGARQFGQTVRYKISAWQTSEGVEIFANTGGSAITYSFTNKLAWPGAGAGSGSPSSGYPSVYFWKEEGVAGNGYINTMIDQNGSLYDIYYPGAGGVQGVGTRNEGYSGGNDTFPPGLPVDHRGQMHLNQIMCGLRVDGLTHWLSNPNGISYTNITQSYVPNSNVIQGTSRLNYGGNNIAVEQVDFAPIGITFPLGTNGQPQRSFHVKRIILTNNGATAKTVSLYAYSDWALNGGDVYDGCDFDASRNAMVAYDRTQRQAFAGGNNIQPPNEYNPTTFGGYNKDISLYLATALKEVGTPGTAGGTWSTDNWRDTSSDQGQGWIGTRITLQPGVPREFNLIVAGGYARPAGNLGVYNQQIAPILDWFRTGNMSSIQAQTNTYWSNWLLDGVMVDLPDDRYDSLWTRSKLASALHIDTATGSLIAGMHNGAYPYVWPRDMMYALVSFARAGHIPEAREMVRWMRDVAYRGDESWGKGFFYQKYTTDGYIVWGAPQVDETAVLPWALLYLYRLTGDDSLLTVNGTMVHDSSLAMSSDSGLDSRLYYDDVNKLMHSMSIWEDSFDEFNYSNANVVRGLWDAATIANRLSVLLGNSPTNWSARAADYNARAANILQGLNGRLAWGGENVDISQLGVTYPFNVIPPNDPRATAILDRINGFQPHPTSGQFRPLVNNNGEFSGLINRYWGDSYWNGGPWWLSTLWFGLFHADRADYTPDKADINLLREKIDLLFPFVGPLGFGAEQVSPSQYAIYPGFKLQTAFPNAWESMSTYMDSVMAFLDYEADMTTNTLRLAPKAPTGWTQMNYNGLRLGPNRFNVAYREIFRVNQLNVTNRVGSATNFDVKIKVPSNARATRVTVGGVSVGYTYDAASGQVRVQGALRTGVNAITAVRVEYTPVTSAATPVSGG